MITSFLTTQLYVSNYGFYYYYVMVKPLHQSLTLFASLLQSLFSHFIIA